MSDDLLKRLAFVSRAICDQWEDLTPEVRDGANAAACAIDEITRLQSQLAKARADVIEAREVERFEIIELCEGDWSDCTGSFIGQCLRDRSLAHGGGDALSHQSNRNVASVIVRSARHATQRTFGDKTR